MYPELPIYRKQTPLILFDPNQTNDITGSTRDRLNDKITQTVNETCSITTQTLNDTFSVNTQTLYYIVDKTSQTESTVTISQFTQTESETAVPSGLFTKPSFPSFKSSIHRIQFPMSHMYQPSSVFSPMATLLTPMGNDFVFLLYLQAQNLRKKVSRIEDDNESLVLQLKKMATQARSTFTKSMFTSLVYCFL